MSSGLSTNNPAIVSAFRAALLDQGLIVLLIVALVAIAWNVARSVQLRRAPPQAGPQFPQQLPLFPQWFLQQIRFCNRPLPLERNCPRA